MSAVGQIERKTQQRVVMLFQEMLGYDYLGDWSDRVSARRAGACRCPVAGER